MCVCVCVETKVANALCSTLLSTVGDRIPSESIENGHSFYSPYDTTEKLHSLWTGH